MNKNEPLVKLAYDNIEPLGCWSDDNPRLARHFKIKTPSGCNVCVIYDNKHNAYAFEYSGGVFVGFENGRLIENPHKFEGLLYAWDSGQVYPKSRLIKWLNENA